MKPIKVFVPFRFKTRNVSNAAELLRFQRGKSKKIQQVYANFIKIVGSNRKTVLFTSNTRLENQFSKGESMPHEI